MIRWAKLVERIRKKKMHIEIGQEKPEGKRSLGRPRRRWESDIKMNVKEMR
jgi:hypothetical protein